MNANQKFKIIVTCCNEKLWISKCVQSIIQQKYDNWEAVVVDANSDDGTYEVLLDNVSNFDKITVVRNQRRETALFNNLLAVKILNPCDEDVLVLLDGDDWFSSTHTLRYLDKVYANPEVWITWGSYKTYPLNNLAYNWCAQRIPSKDFNVRKGNWIFSHLKTCKYFLWKNIKDKDLRMRRTGKYYTAARDLAFMYPMLEMAGDAHRKFVKEILYVYNTRNEMSDGNINREIQLQCLMDIKKRPEYIEQTKENLI